MLAEPLTAAPELDRILADRAIRSVYQPIVGLDAPGTVGFEALARGPEGSSLERPDHLFAAARELGRTTSKRASSSPPASCAPS